MITDIYLKIRNRVSKEFVLRHLAYYLGAFSDQTKYRITLYNEDFNLPKEYYDAYTVVNKTEILKNPLVRNLHERIDRSRIADCWKGAAKAIGSTFYYLSDSEYIVGVDADDWYMPGPLNYYTDRAFQAIKEYELPCLSADYIFSYNIFDTWRAKINRGQGFIPQHWSFGYTVANVLRMRQEIDFALNNLERLIKNIPNCRISQELNLDILLSVLFQHERPQYKFNCFATKEGVWHRGFGNRDSYYHSYLRDDNQMYWEFGKDSGTYPLHHKSLIIR